MKKNAEMNDKILNELLDVVKREYEIERSKKQSFENRTGLILTLLGVIFAYILGVIKIKDILNLFIIPLNFLTLIQIVAGLLSYVSLMFTLIMALKIITVKEQSNFNVKCLTDELFKKESNEVICNIISSYRDIIVQHRELSEIRAKQFKKVLYGTAFMIISILMYSIFI